MWGAGNVLEVLDALAGAQAFADRAQVRIVDVLVGEVKEVAQRHREHGRIADAVVVVHQQLQKGLLRNGERAGAVVVDPEPENQDGQRAAQVDVEGNRRRGARRGLLREPDNEKRVREYEPS